MKKALVIGILLLSLLSLEGYAQKQFRKPLKSAKMGKLWLSEFNAGIKLGCPWSVITKSTLHNIKYDGIFGYQAGVVAEWNHNRYSIGFEGLYGQKGTKMHKTVPYQISFTELDTLTSTYSMTYQVITLRLPFIYYQKGLVKDDFIAPYFFIGPSIDLPSPLQKTITATLVNKDGFGTTKENSTIPKFLNVSVLAGLGVMLNIPTSGSNVLLKFDIAANYGVINLGTAQLVTEGTWIQSHDIEANLTLIVPIKKPLRDAGYYFSRSGYHY